MNRCITDEMIERLALGQSQPEAKRHIQTCSFCRTRLEEAQQFLQNVDEEFQAALTPGEVRIIQSLNPVPGKWIATPIQTITPTIHPSVYAAATAVKLPKREIRRIGLMSTPNREILIRILQTGASGTVKLFLVSDQSINTALVLVKIPAIGFEGVTNTAGEVDLGTIDPTGWKEWQVELQTASAVYNLMVLEGSDGRIQASKDIHLQPDSLAAIQVQFVWENKQSGLQIHLTKMETGLPDENSVYRILVTRGETILGLQKTDKPIVHFKGIPWESGLQIRIFE